MHDFVDKRQFFVVLSVKFTGWKQFVLNRSMIIILMSDFVVEGTAIYQSHIMLKLLRTC